MAQLCEELKNGEAVPVNVMMGCALQIGLAAIKVIKEKREPVTNCTK